VWKRIWALVCLTFTSAAIEVEVGVAIVVVSVSVGIGSEFDSVSGPGVGLVSVRVPIIIVLVFGPTGLLVESLVDSEESWIFKYDWQASFNFCGIDISSDFISRSNGRSLPLEILLARC